MIEPAYLHRISAGAIVEHDGRVAMVNHRKAGSYDFWVCPGGGVIGNETLQAAAIREVREECGIVVEIGPLMYIEEFTRPGLRECKFWFRADYVSGDLDTSAPEATGEHIVRAAWLSHEEVATLAHAFPPVIQSEYWADRDLPLRPPSYLGVRTMDFY